MREQASFSGGHFCGLDIHIKLLHRYNLTWLVETERITHRLLQPKIIPIRVGAWSGVGKGVSSHWGPRCIVSGVDYFRQIAYI